MTPATYHTNCGRAHAIRAGRLRGPRSKHARASHAATVQAFVQAGHGDLLRWADVRKGAIKRAFIKLTDTTDAQAWDTAPTRADAFLKFVLRNPVWVAAIMEGTAP